MLHAFLIQEAEVPEDTVTVQGNQHRNGPFCLHSPPHAQGFPSDVGPDQSSWGILGTSGCCAASLASTHPMPTAPNSGRTTKTVSRHCSMSPVRELPYPACQAASDYAVTCLPVSICSLHSELPSRGHHPSVPLCSGKSGTSLYSCPHWTRL